MEFYKVLFKQKNVDFRDKLLPCLPTYIFRSEENVLSNAVNPKMALGAFVMIVLGC